jgi:type I restriction enzyme S subunit
MVGVAGQKRVPGEFVKDFEFDLPSLDDQRRIADFLDAETGRLDRLVHAKNRLPRLLDEKLAATLERLIGHGRNRPWPLKYLVNPARPIMYGIVLPGQSVENGVPLVKGGDVERGSLHPTGLARVAPEIEAAHARSRVRGGDLLVSIRGSFGAVAEVPAELTGANITQDSARVSPGGGIDGRYLLYALRSSGVRHQLGAVVTGATIRGVNIRDLKRVNVPVPGTSRQREIARELDDLTQQLARLKSALSRHLGLIAEHREALITATVTGQLNPSSYRASVATT